MEKMEKNSSIKNISWRSREPLFLFQCSFHFSSSCRRDEKIVANRAWNSVLAGADHHHLVFAARSRWQLALNRSRFLGHAKRPIYRGWTNNKIDEQKNEPKNNLNKTRRSSSKWAFNNWAGARLIEASWQKGYYNTRGRVQSMPIQVHSTQT